jgi:NUBPL iron-transfer P-loop NTPase
MSIGFILDSGQPLVGRGRQVSGALMPIFSDVDWADSESGLPKPRDERVPDMPPGPGDIPLTIVQRIRLSGAVIVSTPQDVALGEVRRGHGDVQENRRARFRRSGRHDVVRGSCAGENRRARRESAAADELSRLQMDIEGRMRFGLGADISAQGRKPLESPENTLKIADLDWTAQVGARFWHASRRSAAAWENFDIQ